MLQDSNRSIGMSVSGLRYMLGFPVLLVFALLLVAPSPARPNLLPKPDYDLVVSRLPRVLCAGENYELTVSVQGKPIKKMFPPNLTAVIDNTEVASLDAPATGGEDSAEDDLPSLPAARSRLLTVYALKPGTAKLTITSKLSPRLTKISRGVTFTVPLDFEVVNCNYTMDIEYKIKLDDPLGYSDAYGGVDGIKLKLNPETKQISGRGQLISTVTGGWNTGGEICEDNTASVKSPVAIRGKLNNDILDLEMYFLPVYFPVIRKCSRIELGGAKNPMPDTTATVSLFGPIPHLDKSITPDGVARDYEGIYPPAPHLTGETTITVAPEETLGR